MQLPLAIVLTLTFVWLYFNVNFKSDIQFNFPYKFRASFWSSSYCCGILFHSGLWVRGSGSCQPVVSPLLSAGRDHRSNAQILYLEPPFTTASCSRNAIDQDMTILSLCFNSVHTLPAYSQQDLPLIGIFYTTFRYVSWDIVVIGLEVARVVPM